MRDLLDVTRPLHGYGRSTPIVWRAGIRGRKEDPVARRTPVKADVVFRSSGRRTGWNGETEVSQVIVGFAV
jgi:hypothetical protein